MSLPKYLQVREVINDGFYTNPLLVKLYQELFNYSTSHAKNVINTLVSQGILYRNENGFYKINI